eukprot:CAMPEP_0172302592 /NCGR_PEP_ID=MMETSP1058-20130122/4268_1 /TAXON_ID=83371 /ORGANISM="Detonula confervacea, Strain CCMP 353" /LENGTH=284 /DNA_ID=CAMNT_0013013121 /DNA_START=150 /DNA_END=1004 /DNA_ORIENTATION=+
MAKDMARSVGSSLGSIPTTESVPILIVNDKHYNCAGCGEKNEFKHNLKRCTACLFVKYCSRDCQLSHRKAHKSFCNREKKLTEDAQFPKAELIDASYWKSIGHGDVYAYGTMPLFQRTIFIHSNGLFNANFNGKREISLGNAKDGKQDLQIPHDDKLMPTWERLAYALSNCPQEQTIDLFSIWNVDLTPKVLEVLAPCLSTLPIKRLSFSGNAMDNECIEIVTKILQKNMSIKEFDCEYNRPEDIVVNRKLYAAVEAHPNLELYKTCSLSRTFNPGSDKEKGGE